MTRTRRTRLQPVDLAGAESAQDRQSPPRLAAPISGIHEYPSAHRVQFYETDAFLLEAVSEFIGAGLDGGTACIVLATPAHRYGLAQRLQGNGFALTQAQVQGQYIALDAAETLAQLLVDGSPDPARFAQVVGGMIERAAQGKRGVRVFGEMVALLWEQGNPAAALGLEALWNALDSTILPFTLLCAYPSSLFASSAHADLFTRMCALHSQVIPDERYMQLADQDEQLRAVSLFQQRANSLAAEMAERQAAEERLGRSEQRYHRLFEATTDGILIVEPDSGCITDANPALLQLLGRSYEQVVDWELWQVGLLPGERAQQAFLRRVRRERVLQYQPMTLVSARGERREVEWLSTLYQANGQEVLQCTLRDITDRRLAEEARLHLAAIVSSSDDAILSKDLNGIVTSWNAAAERMYGYRAQEMVGQPVTLLFPPDRQDEFTQIMERIRLGERVDHYETLRVCKDGTLLPVSVTVSPIKDRNGTIIGASAIVRDISKREALERQREAFISLVTHELKTPLTSLQANLQLAQRRLARLLGQAEQLDEAQQRTLEDVLSMLGRSRGPLQVQQRLIHDLLDLALLQEGKMQLHLEVCDLATLVTETVQDHQTVHSARLITLDLPESEPLLVSADRDRLQQVLNNYLTNALKFSPQTEPVRVGIAVEAEVARVWVQDQGPGLSAEQQAQIWQQFYQLPDTPVQSGWKGGLGLGLYISQQLIRRQGGEVSVASRPGEGATFWFSLPLRLEEPSN